MPQRPTLVVGQQSLFDRSRVPDGGKTLYGGPDGGETLYAYARVPADLPVDEGHAVELVERQIERFAPGFGRLVRARAVRTPAHIEAENASMRGGDLASGSCELDQQLVFRPAVELCRGRTPVKGLFVAGAWVHPGPGVHGVSGDFAGRALARELRVRGIRAAMKSAGGRLRHPIET
jgi:phytoene dehydrogenase-like protein